MRKAEEWGSRNSKKLAEFVEGPQSPLIVYSGAGYVPARILYWGLTILAYKNPLYMDAEAAAYHLAPYREGLSTVLFSLTGLENNLFRLLDTARLTGHRLLLVSPPLPKRMEHKVGPHKHITVPGHVDPVLAEAILAFKASASLAKHPDRLRAARITEEAGSIHPIVQSLLEAYGEKLAELKTSIGAENTIVTYTPLMEAPATLLRDSLERLGLRTGIYEAQTLVSLMPPNSNIIAFTTGVEGFIVREMRAKAVARNSALIELELRTDPLSAQIYGIILVKALEEALGRGS